MHSSLSKIELRTNSRHCGFDILPVLLRFGLALTLGLDVLFFHFHPQIIHIGKLLNTPPSTTIVSPEPTFNLTGSKKNGMPQLMRKARAIGKVSGRYSISLQIIGKDQLFYHSLNRKQQVSMIQAGTSENE